jgi:hypothetical protein
LFGHSFAPREEYLLLKLFYLAVLKEIKHLKSDINELTQTDSIIPKMLITYNKRKQGVEFLKGTLGIYLKKFLTEDYEFELKPLAVSKLYRRVNVSKLTLLIGLPRLG